MKWKFWIIISVLAAALPAWAQKGTTNAEAVISARDAALDEAAAPVLDIEARYWAGRVLQGETSLSSLEADSKNWPGSSAQKNQLIQKVSQYVEQGDFPRVTPQERSAINAAKTQSREILTRYKRELQSANLKDARNFKRERDEKISAITAQVRDIEARVLAMQVLSGNQSLFSLKENMGSWLGTPEEHKRLMALTSQYIQKGHVPPLTEQEAEKLEENKRQVQLFLHGRENPANIALANKNRQITKIKTPVFAIEARYWAWRIAKVKDTTFEELANYSAGWAGERTYNARLIQAISENLEKGNTAPLSKKEKKKLKEATQKVKQLLN